MELWDHLLCWGYYKLHSQVIGFRHICTWSIQLSTLTLTIASLISCHSTNVSASDPVFNCLILTASSNKCSQNNRTIMIYGSRLIQFGYLCCSSPKIWWKVETTCIILIRVHWNWWTSTEWITLSSSILPSDRTWNKLDHTRSRKRLARRNKLHILQILLDWKWPIWKEFVWKQEWRQELWRFKIRSSLSYDWKNKNARLNIESIFWYKNIILLLFCFWDLFVEISYFRIFFFTNNLLWLLFCFIPYFLLIFLCFHFDSYNFCGIRLYCWNLVLFILFAFDLFYL